MMGPKKAQGHKRHHSGDYEPSSSRTRTTMGDYDRGLTATSMGPPPSNTRLPRAPELNYTMQELSHGG